MECELLCDDFFELELVTDGDNGAPCSGLELPFDSSHDNNEGGVGGKPNPKKCQLWKLE